MDKRNISGREQPSETGRLAALQVKTATTDVFRLGLKDERPARTPNDWYVLVALGEATARPRQLCHPRYGNRDWDEVAFRDELEHLKDRLDLTLVHVLERTPPRWRGETGYVTADVLARHLPVGYQRFQFSSADPIR